MLAGWVSSSLTTMTPFGSLLTNGAVTEYRWTMRRFRKVAPIRRHRTRLR